MQVVADRRPSSNVLFVGRQLARCYSAEHWSACAAKPTRGSAKLAWLVSRSPRGAVSHGSAGADQARAWDCPAPSTE
jgi:hypothetical protein